jgi:peptide/nickel transport system permease protein
MGELTVSPVPAEEGFDARGARPGWVRGVLASGEGRIGLACAIFILAVIIFGRFVTPYDPYQIGVGPPATGPSREHLLGTDSLGRDVLSRFLVGGGSVLLIPTLAVTIAYLIGGALGMYGAYVGGRRDDIIARGFDVGLTVPPLLLVLVIIAGLGDSIAIITATVALVFIPRVGRVIRGATQAVVSNEYVAAAEARGERTYAIVSREIGPNIIAPAIADFALRITFAVMFVATLNFLGIGADPPSAAWGLNVAEQRGILSVAPLASLAPAIGIALLAVSSNLLADALTRQFTRDTSERPLL